MTRLAACTLLFSGLLSGQPKKLGSGPHRMEITVEREDSGGWGAVDPGLVFSQDDRIRFRFRANFDGYLYVQNHSSSGQYMLLFPREETGRQNRIAAGTEYLVPATESWFRIAGPPGYETVYWLVSPVPLETGEPFRLPSRPSKPPTLLPRCDDAILRARGACIDSSAGPKSVGAREALPENLAAVPGARSRELVILRQQNLSVVSSPAPLTGPVIYEFRLAHK